MQHVVNVGSLITGPEDRDAIHIAVFPMVADEDLRPGDPVNRMDNGRFGRTNRSIGIVDPFLKDLVKEGQTCWLFLHPNTINSLRHDWSHPVLDVAPNNVQEDLDYNDADADADDDESCSC